jgi:peptide/nickel transport system permease protein
MAAVDPSILVRPGQLDRIRTFLGEARFPWLPVVILAALLILGLGANVIAPFDPTDNDLRSRAIPPFTDMSHPLGTDILGKDMLSRLIFGARTVLLVSVPSMAIAVLVGTTIGLVAGYAGRWVDSVLMRITDATLGFPSILVAMLIVTLIGTGITGVVVAVTATTWARFSRMIRGEVLSTRERDFVLLARISGVSPAMIIWRHLFPNVINTLMVLVSLTVGQVILLEASLSFLGLGMKPGEPAWGIMVAEGRQQLVTIWWLSLFPGIMITVVVVAFNFFGDWLRDYLDPRMRRAR